MHSYLGEAVANVASNTDGLYAIRFPRGVDEQIIASLVLTANSELVCAPTAVRVTSECLAESYGGSLVRPQDAIAYRAGTRTFVWREGDFDPDASFMSTVSFILDVDFPEAESDRISLDTLGGAIAERIKTKTDVDLFTEPQWGELASAIAGAARVAKAAYQEAGSSGVVSWPAEWWRILDRGVSTIVDELNSHTPESRPEAEAIAYAALGLPARSSAGLPLTGVRLYDAVNSNWYSLERAQWSLEYLDARCEEGVQHPLTRLPWTEEYEARLHSERHQLTAFMSLGYESRAERLAVWYSTSIGDLLLQRGAQTEEQESPSVFVGGTQAPLLEDEVGTITVMPVDFGSIPAGTSNHEEVFVVPDVVLSWPAGEPEGLPLPDDPPRVAVDSRGVTCISTGIDSTTNGFELTCRIEIDLRRQWPDRPVRFTLDTSNIPALAARMKGGREITILFPDPWSAPSLFFVEARKRRNRLMSFAGGQCSVTNSLVTGEDEEWSRSISFRQERRGLIASYDARPNVTGPVSFQLQDNNRRASTVDQWPRLAILRDCILQHGSSIVGLDEETETRVDIQVEQGVDAPYSPVLAAALGRPPRPMTEPYRREAGGIDLLSDLERLLIGWIDDYRNESDVGRTAGMYQGVLPAGIHEYWGGGQVENRREPIWLGTSRRPANGIPNAGWGGSESLLESDEAREFNTALESVVTDLLLQQGDADEFLISRAKISELDHANVARYCRAFTNLINHAERLSGRDRFWASYPLSFMIYNQSASKIESILLSPLHPLRLGWLFGVENALLEASEEGDNVSSLLQFVEGWNLPAYGPLPAAEGEDMIAVAVPMDYGPDVVHLGWSQLAWFDNPGGSKPAACSWAAGRRLPGTATSGLTASSVTTAIDNYLRVHPYCTTLSLDLHAPAPSSRSRALDRALLSHTAELGRRGKPSLSLPGGLRVFDSTNRIGMPPSSEDMLTMVGGDTSRLPRVQWQRYGSGSTHSADIRFVESGDVLISRKKGQALGVIPPYPVRRFVIRTDGGHRQHVVLREHSREHALQEYSDSLSMFERIRDNTYSIVADSHIQLEALETSATWMVTGNVHLDPRVFAGEVAETGRLLWEWRPGYLSLKGYDQLAERVSARAFTTVSQIPNSFRFHVARSLDVSQTDADTLFQELGYRGIGLASLLALGHQHAAGALGFFLGYRLLDVVPNERGSTRLIVPIDAVDSLIRAVTGDKARDYTKRADLLVMEVDYRDDFPYRLLMTPVEIRCSPGASGSAPSVDSRAVRKKVVQLHDSLATIGRLVERYVQTKDREYEGNRQYTSALVVTAVASLVECGLTLSPERPSGEMASLILEGVLTGQLELDCERGIVLWFQDTASRELEWYPDRPDTDVGVLLADLESCRNVLWSRSYENQFAGILQSIEEWLQKKDARGATTEDQADNLASSGETEDERTEERAGVEGNHSDDRSTGAREHSETEFGSGAERPKVYLGNDPQGREVTWDPQHPAKKLTNAHVVIVGGSGVGKTQTVMSYLKDLSTQGISPLILDFKDDYSDEEFRTRFGLDLADAAEGLPFNPLVPSTDPISGRILVQNQVYQIASSLTHVYKLGDQQAASLRKAILRTYESAGLPQNATAIPEDVVIPSIAEVGTELENMGEIRLYSRLSPLFDLDLFSGGNVTAKDLLRIPTVVRFRFLPTDDVRRAAADLTLRSVYDSMVLQGHRASLQTMIVIDEAHKIANLDTVRSLMKEARSYGVSLILSSQEARDFEDFVFANAGTLISLKLSETADARRVAALLAHGSEEQELRGTIQTLPKFQALLRNEQYTAPYVRVSITPYFER